VARSDAAPAGPTAARTAARSPGPLAERPAAAWAEATAAHTARRTAAAWAGPAVARMVARTAGRLVPAYATATVARTSAAPACRGGAARDLAEATRRGRAWAVRIAAPTAARTAGRTAVSSAARTAAPTAVVRVARKPATVETTAERTAVPMRAGVQSARPVERPESPNVPRRSLRRHALGPDRCGAGGPCRAGHQPSSTPLRRRRPNSGRGRPATAPTSNGGRRAGSPRISGCRGRVRAAGCPGLRTTRCCRRPTIDRARASAAPPIAAAATTVPRLTGRSPPSRCAIRHDYGARSTRSPLPAHCREWSVAARSRTNTHRYRRRPTPSRARHFRTGNSPYGCGRDARATDTTRVPLGWEDLIGHFSVPDGRPHPSIHRFHAGHRGVRDRASVVDVRSFRTPYAARHCPTSAWRLSPHPAAPAGRDIAAAAPRRRVRSARPYGLRHAASPRRHA